MFRYGTPYRRSTVVAANVPGPTTHLAGTCCCTKPYIPLQGGRVCTSAGNRSVWLSSLASQYPPKFCRKFAQAASVSAPHDAQASARDPAQRWTAAVLAATLSPLDGNSLSTPGAYEYLVTASMQGWAAGSKSARATTWTRHSRTFSTIRHMVRSASSNGPQDDLPTTCRRPCSPMHRWARQTAVIHYGPRHLRCVGQDP